ncbi:ATP-binding protein [Streptomyces sp. NPDC057620]|uniref:wHTH domain-containing protein n=1 Tax=Streptomyces sp. NPDC057620 TaxID=3346185 RepID=UPI00368B7382
MQHLNSRNVVGGHTSASSIVQIGSVDQLTVHQATSATPTVSYTEDNWGAHARSSSVWGHVPDNRDTARYREMAAFTAARLAALRDEAEPALAADPWQETEFAPRFAERVEWLLGEPGQGTPLDLYPAEATLLVLTPYLYSVHALQTAVRRLDVRPWALGPAADAAGSQRRSFEAFAQEHGMLVQRGLLRRESEPAIGWWLFHRWLVRQGANGDDDSVGRLLRAVGEPVDALGDALDPARVSRVLHGLRRGPDVCNPEYLDALPADDRLRGPGHQRIRDQRLTLVTALAYAVSVEMTALPSIVAEHLGIPHPVDLPRLRSTLERSSWGGSPDLPVLRADCAHESVIEGLRAHTARADELLHTVSRTVRDRINQPMPVLPSRLSCDGVLPGDGAFTAWAGFRLDERRVRDLLMGVQLYKDRDLAVRELYQNALDACRYRRARTEYLDRTDSAASYAYDGRVLFEQGTDDEDRAYLECRDNGIGMGEAELRGVFSNAGARFAEQPDFKEERAAWNRLDPPVEFHPNSRFGIGVLSYFMLADEIRVTTCRMGPTGAPGPVLQVSIFGPGHLFRILRVAERGDEPGTVVRIYLRPDEERSDSGEPEEADSGWSCTDVLNRLLGIAEFLTEARNGSDVRQWTPGKLSGRKRPDGELFGLDAAQALAPWPGAPAGAQVIWCGHGGGLLVDGLVVQPAVRGDVLSSQPSGLTGVVVNLSGAYSPERLSADRSQVLDDLRPVVRELLTGAVEFLVSDNEPILDFAWLSDVAHGSMATADLIAKKCIATGHKLSAGESFFDTAQTGILPADASLVRKELVPYASKHGNPLLSNKFAQVPNHVYLWRLLAHRPHRTADQLAQLCPEIAAVGPVLPALPSDHLLLAEGLGTNNSAKNIPELLTSTAAVVGTTPREAALRSARLGLHDLPPEAFPDARLPLKAAQKAVHDTLRGIAARSKTITVASLVREASGTGATVDESANRWREQGVAVPDAVYATAAAVEKDQELFDHLSQKEASWFVPDATVHCADLVSTALDLGVTVPELCDRLVQCGLKADGTNLPSEPTAELAIQLREYLTSPEHDSGPGLPLTTPVPPYLILLTAEERQLSPAETIKWYAGLGFLPPTPFPDLIEPTDEHLLTDTGEYADNAPLRPGDHVDYLHVLAASAELAIPLWDVAARLRAFGVVAPLQKPDMTSPLDLELFTEEGPLSWYGVTAAEGMPFAHVLAAARRLLTSPEDILARLAAHGIPMSCPELPKGLSYQNALVLLSTREDDILLSAEEHVSFQDLLARARLMHEPIERVRCWLTELGLSVDDPAEVIRAALPLVPRA